MVAHHTNTCYRGSYGVQAFTIVGKDAKSDDNFPNNTDARTLGDLSDLPQDSYRFYRVQPRDSSTILVVYQVRLENRVGRYR